jgi:hypothetical protein
MFGRLDFKIYSADAQSLIFHSVTGDALIFVILAFLASMAYSDETFVQDSQGISRYILFRSQRCALILARTVIVAVSGFIVSTLPFLFNSMLCLIAFPLASTAHDSNQASNSDVLQYATRTMLFPSLHLHHPYLSLMLHIALAGVFGVVVAISSHTLSLYFQKNRLVAIGAVPVLFVSSTFILDTLGLGRYELPRYISAAGGYKGIRVEYFAWIVALLLCINIILITIKLLLRQNELRE